MKRLLMIGMMLAAGCSMVGPWGSFTSAPETVAEQPAEELYAVEITTTKGHRRLGEKTSFTVSVRDKQSGVLVTGGMAKVRLDNFGSRVFFDREMDLARSNPFTIRGALSEPGFLRMQVDVEGGTRGQNGGPLTWSVPYEPEQIVQGMPEPKDFDAFWKNAISELGRNVSGAVTCELVPKHCTDKLDYYSISVESYGRRCYGMLSVPKKPGRHQAIVTVPGAGMKSWAFDLIRDEWRVRLTLPVFDFEPVLGDVEGNEAKAQKSVRELIERYGVKSYPMIGAAESPEAYYYYAVILGNIRLVRWLSEQSFVNPKDIAYEGTSQGGGNGLFLLGLMPDVFARGRINVAALTDQGGYRVGRCGGWPHYDSEPALADQMNAVERVYPYFDGVNFAARIKCPVRFTVGYADVTCPPPAVWSAYNRVKVADKQIYECYGEDHYTAPWRPYGDELSNWVMGLK